MRQTWPLWEKILFHIQQERLQGPPQGLEGGNRQTQALPTRPSSVSPCQASASQTQSNKQHNFYQDNLTPQRMSIYLKPILHPLG